MPVLKGEQSVIINAPADEVYEYISDFPRHSEWNHQPQEITKVSDGPTGVGTVFRAREKPPGKAPWVIRKVMMPLMLKLVGSMGYTEAEITALEPGRRIAWTAVAPRQKGGHFMKAEWDLLLEPQNGATRVTQRYHYMPAHKLFEIGGNEQMAQSTADEVDDNLARLKQILEAQRAHEPHPA